MKLPEILQGQSWCCSEGCGDCAPKEIDFEYSRTTDKYGSVLDSKVEKIWISSCCEAELLLWDEDAQDFVEWERGNEG